MTLFARDRLQEYPLPLLAALAAVARRRGRQFYIAGGPVRDWLMGRAANDLDVTVAADAFGCAHDLARELGGAFVPLDLNEDVARVVWRKITVDFSAFREGTSTIEADLLKRDFTINAMAVSFDAERPGLCEPFAIIDPTAGCADIKAGLIRCTSTAVLGRDPLRLLRAYRFTATLGFVLDAATREVVRQQVLLIDRVSAERLAYELDIIMASGRAAAVVGNMADSGLLWRLFPELRAGVGVTQPASHHLDVFGHCLAALRHMEELQQNPTAYFPGYDEVMNRYLAGGRKKALLKWAALFHDLGKPASRGVREDKGGRITFYQHDRLGARQFNEIAGRLKWSKADTKMVRGLIEIHMWPFHLNNARHKTGVTPRAYMRLVKAAADDMNGLFMLAMADCLAGRGPGRPPAIEEEITELYGDVYRFYLQSIKPVLENPRLLTGHDLIELFGLSPGPFFARILKGLENARVAGLVRTRPQAVQWVRNFLEE